MPNLRRYLLIISLAITVSASASNTLKVGFFESTGMFEGAADGVHKSGYCYDYMMQIAAYTGWNYEFVYGSFASLYEQLKNGEIDILPYTNYNEQRGKEVLFSENPLAIEEYYLAVKKDYPLSAGASALNGGTISTMKDADYNSLLQAFIRENNLNVKLNYFHYVDEIWDAMRSGQATATIYTSNSYSHDDWECICSFGKKPTYICVAKDRQDILDKLNEATDLIQKESPALQENLYAKYFSDNPVRRNLTVEEQAWADAHPVIHVGGFDNDAPYIFSYDESTHTATGLTADVLNDIINRLGLNIDTDYRCYASLEEMEAALDAGEIDVICPFYPDYYVAQDHNLFISNTVRSSNMALAYRKGTTFSAALNTVATPSTRLGIYYVRDNYPGSSIIPATSIKDALDKVNKGEATGAIAQSVMLQNIKENYDNLNYAILAEGCGTCYAARPENYPLLRIINRGLIYMTSAEISAISARYTPESKVTFKEFLATHKDVAVLLVLILAVLIILVIVLFQLNGLKKKADAANKSKTTFLNNMSHDMRTPLNAISGFNNMALIELGKDNEKVRGYLGKIGTASDMLLTIIDDILEISRIEAGKITLSEDKGNVMYSFANTDAMMLEVAQQAGIDLQFSFGNVDDKYVICDMAHCGRIFTNLISNAIKYTRKGGNVRVHCEQTGRRDDGYGIYVYTIADNGIGMSEEFQKQLFQPFSRERSSTVSHIQGTGLGLSVSKDLVELMGGTITCRSQQGEGTVFTVTLPFKIQEGQEYTEPVRHTINLDRILEGKSILLVEDNELNREIASALISEMGGKVTEADDGFRAIEIMKNAQTGDYDMILMDIQMPIIDGYEATKKIRSMGTEISRIPIIAMTANAYEEDRQSALAAGMNEHIAKPIDVAKLKVTLSRFI